MRHMSRVAGCLSMGWVLLCGSGCASVTHGVPLPASTATTVLVHKSPAEAGLSTSVLGDIDSLIEEGIQTGAFPGAVVLVVRHGVIAKEQAYGYAVEYQDDTGMRVPSPTKMSTDSIFDLASLSKLFTTVAVMKLYEEGKLQLDAPVAQYIPAFGQNAKGHVTLRMLLTHTSGLAPSIPLWKDYKTVPERMAAIYREKLTHASGSTYVYSDLNFIVLGNVVEKVSGQSLQQFVHDQITSPLGMNNTMYNPPESLKNRIAATEYQPWTNRGLLWGEVEDENAWSLRGVAGHAGVFSSAGDVAILAQMILNGGTYNGHLILKSDTVQVMEQKQTLAGHEHALGIELNQAWYMGMLAGPDTLGHTGFSGTSIVIDKKNDVTCILLTNRVHPSRKGPSMNPYRSGFANDVANAILN